MSDYQTAMLAATVPVLIAVLICLPVWFWIYTVRARRKEARIEYALWWEGVEAELKVMDFSKITVGTVTADRIKAVDLSREGGGVVRDVADALGEDAHE